MTCLQKEVSIFTLSMPRHVDAWRPLVCTGGHSSSSPLQSKCLAVAVFCEGDRGLQRNEISLVSGVLQ